MKDKLLQSVSKSELELLSISSKTDLLTESMLNNVKVIEDGISTFKSLVFKGLVNASKEPDGFHISHDPELALVLDAVFIGIETGRRFQICKLISENFLSRGKTLEALKILTECGDLRYFTEALKLNTIELRNREGATALLDLTNVMLREDNLDEMAYRTFRITSHIWRGEYLQALENLESLERDISAGKLEKHFETAILILRASANRYMGRLVTSHKILKEFMASLNKKPLIQDSAVILGCKLYAASALSTNNYDVAEESLRVASEYIKTDEGNIPYMAFQLLQIEAIKLFVEGNLNAAYEKSKIAIFIAKENSYIGVQGPTESLYIKASCEEEFLDHAKAVETWKVLLENATSYNLPSWYCIAYLRMKKAEYFLSPKIDLNEAVFHVRNFYQSLPYKHELDVIVDIEELFIAYRLNSFERAKTLLKRIPSNPRVNEIAIALEIMNGKFPKQKRLQNQTVRNKLMQLLIEANDPNISENKLKSYIHEALNLSEQYGWYRVICMQNQKYLSMVLRIASEGHNAYREQIAQLITQIIERKSLKPIEERLSLTAREREVLTLLAAGFERNEICHQLSLSFNTLKTHQKNLYLKLEANTRESAINNAKKLGLLTH